MPRPILFTLLSLALAGGRLLAADQPNILLIVADDLGYEMLGAYGGTGTDTPCLDRMAENGVRFTRAYTSPVCTPSRMSIYTGTYPTRHQYTRVLPVHEGTREAVDFRHRFTTTAQVLRAAGYQTSVTGKWQLAALEYHPEHCREAGFDSWCVWQIWKDGAKTTRYWNPTLNRDGQILDEAKDRFGPDVLADYVIERMRTARDAGQPFFIQHNMLLPHVPLVPTPEDKAQGAEPSLARMVSYMDGIVGRLLRATGELDIARDTIVIFAGDNGTESKELRTTASGPVSGGKWDLTDAGTHVPLIILQPGRFDGGRTVSQLVDFADLFPTICELAGVGIPEGSAPDGISFFPQLNGREGPSRQFITAAIGDDFIVFDGQWRMHREGRKLIDCRDLPRESPAKPDDPEAREAFQRLAPIIDTLDAM